MTSVPSAPVDHSVDAPADQSALHTPDTPRASTTAASADDSTAQGGDTNQKENVRPVVEGPLGVKSHAGQGGQNTQSSAQEDLLDDFGLPLRPRSRPARSPTESSGSQQEFHDVQETVEERAKRRSQAPVEDVTPEAPRETKGEEAAKAAPTAEAPQVPAGDSPAHEAEAPQDKATETPKDPQQNSVSRSPCPDCKDEPPPPYTERPSLQGSDVPTQSHAAGKKAKPPQASEWSHQRLYNAPNLENDENEVELDDGGWKDMKAVDEFDVYDDYGRLVVRGGNDDVEQEAAYAGLGSASKGYTRVQLDEDAQSATSMDEDTSYLFKAADATGAGVEEEELRDTVSQLQATKDLLTEGQRIAYVGVTRLSIYQMVSDMEKIPATRGTRKTRQKAIDAMRKWGQAMMARVYSHMEIDSAEQIMIEQLAGHGVQPADLVPPLMQNARVKNPLAEEGDDSPKKSTSSINQRSSPSTDIPRSSHSDSPPPYETHEGEDLPEVRTPSQMPTSSRIDIDLRWTVLCDLFLVLIADAEYDARSRTLLERVGNSMEVSWLQISRFEKRVVDALEMQESAEKETWDETEHMEQRKKKGKTRKYVAMGLATVGGGLVIGLSAGLLAPVIGAGLAAGLTTVGITGTSTFLGGVGGTALIASSATFAGSSIGLRASNRRTGAVQTFEYRPLHNNKRVNLIVTVAGWMTGKVDDVRLPFSTVDPIMGDIYSVLWEPEMLQSMGATINILATEALINSVQQVLGNTVLVALMSSLQLPLVLTKLAYLIDNPWTVSLARANAAGLVLADSLMDHNLGKRPVTLVGYSIGSRVIFSCLKELAEKGANGLVQNVYLFGSPIVASRDEYIKARGVVSGRFVNGFASNDWILGYLFRATSGGIMRVAGLAAVEGIPGIENFDVTKLVNGHMDYRTAMPRLMKEVGWEVLSEEFAEIEDPDPESHAERQRELIREIDEARKEAEAKPEKKRFGLFKRGKLAQKKGWETYDVERNNSLPSRTSSETPAGSVLFDIDAIRAELASEAIEVKQLESTLPPMKLDLNPSSSPATTSSPADDKSPKKADATPSTPASASVPEPSTQKSDVPPPAQPQPHDEEVELTFDTSYHESSPPPRSHTSFEPGKADPEPTRPELRSSATMPVGAGTFGGAAVGASAVGAMALEPNAWADYGEEGEIQMSFE
ncbi:uncharacterized protein BDW47DRAFT_43089 [Aspergillus candidus]|uniref:DUF726-domain-containing protein n=1 Tax=Aspergillus candidus TaxID=41067 RepID=A0A2I2FMV0_ASPCN|nr:hypothetical protein BDW47DRAFT_43089 [Aspergillus candidus]PLB41941.1 hypothetical protein BDW47DRAFT_43089 [Aspergillus candidus]